VQDRIRTAVSELGVHYRNSPIIRDDAIAGLSGMVAGWLHAAPRAGDRAPDGMVSRVADRSPVRLFELTPGTRHVLLILTGSRLGREDARRRAEPLAAVVSFADLIDAHVVAPGPAAPPDATLLDPDGSLHRAYGADDETLVLIRPDGYVGYRSRPADAPRLRDYLRRIFI